MDGCMHVYMHGMCDDMHVDEDMHVLADELSDDPHTYCTMTVTLPSLPAYLSSSLLRYYYY